MYQEEGRVFGEGFEGEEAGNKKGGEGQEVNGKRYGVEQLLCFLRAFEGAEDRKCGEDDDSEERKPQD